MAKTKADNSNKKSGGKKSSKREEIAISGSKTKGTEVGAAREIKAPEMGDAQKIEAALIDPAREIEAAKLGDAETVSGIGIDESKQEEFRAYQLGLAKQLEAQTRGEGASLAALQLKQGTEQNIAQQAAIAASGQGVNGALAQRTAAMNVGNLNQQSALQAAQLRMAEQLNAQNALSALTQSARGQDISLATSQADLQLQQALANQQERNKFQLAQADLSQQANIANQQAFNTRAGQQAALYQQAGIANQQAFNTRQEQQAALAQQAAIANQQSFNSVQATQADINAKIRASQIAAGAQTAAAAAGAAASRYGTDASLYKFNQELAFEMDKYYQGQGRADINDIYTTNQQGIQADSKIRDDQFNVASNFGSAIAQGQATGSLR